MENREYISKDIIRESLISLSIVEKNNVGREGWAMLEWGRDSLFVLGGSRRFY